MDYGGEFEPIIGGNLEIGKNKKNDKPEEVDEHIVRKAEEEMPKMSGGPINSVANNQLEPVAGVINPDKSTLGPSGVVHLGDTLEKDFINKKEGENPSENSDNQV